MTRNADVLVEALIDLGAETRFQLDESDYLATRFTVETVGSTTRAIDTPFKMTSLKFRKNLNKR